MKKFVRILILFGILILGNIGQMNNVKAAPTDFYTLTEGIEIDGPERIFEIEHNAQFKLKLGSKEKEINAYCYGENNDMNGLKLKWRSSNSKVLKFKERISQYSSGCIVELVPYLEQPNIYEISKGKATIKCVIEDNFGHKRELSKEVTVLGGRPIKSLSIGKNKVKKNQLKGVETIIFTNKKQKKAKVKVKLAKNWEITSIKGYLYRKSRGWDYYEIKKKPHISLESGTSDDNTTVLITIKNKKTNPKFEYSCDIYRYENKKLELGKLQKGCVLLTMRHGGFDRPYVHTIKYKKNSKKSDPYTFKNKKDLVRKLLEYDHYDSQAMKLKNGIIYYKEYGRQVGWYYARNKKEVDKLTEVIEKRYDIKFF